MPVIEVGDYWDAKAEEVVRDLDAFLDKKLSVPKLQLHFGMNRDAATRLREVVRMKQEDPVGYEEARRTMKERIAKEREVQRLKLEALRAPKPAIHLPSQEEREEVHRRIEEERANPRPEYGP